MKQSKKPILAATYSSYKKFVEKKTISSSARRRALLKMLGAPDGTIGSTEDKRNGKPSRKTRERLELILARENVVFENDEARRMFIDSVSEAYCMLLRVASKCISTTDTVTNENFDGTSPLTRV